MNIKSFEGFDNKSFLKFSNPALVQKDLQTLVGLIQGVKCDEVISEQETDAIRQWLVAYKDYENKQPYKEIISLLREAFADDILTNEEAENVIWFCNHYIEKTDYFDMLSLSIQNLIGIVKGIVIDNEINAAELQYLDNWLEDNAFLKNTYPYDEIYNLTTSLLQKKIILKEEMAALTAFCKAFTGDESTSSNQDFINALQTGFYQIDPQIDLPQSTFCITGVSKKYKRKEIAEKIELHGGYVTDSVSSKLNYLVVCDEKNSCWAFTCYGRKIEEAIKHRKQGKEVLIIHEFDLFDELESHLSK